MSICIYNAEFPKDCIRFLIFFTIKYFLFQIASIFHYNQNQIVAEESGVFRMTQSPKVSIPSIVGEEITSDYSHSVQSYELFFTVPNNSYKLGRRSIEHISVPHEIYLYAP